MEIFKVTKKIEIGTCIVTYNRLELTKMTIESYLATASVSNYIVVVDNGSDNETINYLQSLGSDVDLVIYNEKQYPGFACNQAWDEIIKNCPDVKLLHRSDNDMFYRRGWDRYVVDLFELFPKLGLFGLLDLTEKHYFGIVPTFEKSRNGYKYNAHRHDIGGAYVTRREIFQSGIRHLDTPWTKEPDGWEDRHFTKSILEAGWDAGHAMEFLTCHLGTAYGWRKDNSLYEYYKKTYEERNDETFEEFLHKSKVKS